MHIAMIAPPWFPIPPVAYGGIERVIYDLVESLTETGHEVTLFAPEGSETSAKLVPAVHSPAGLDLPENQKAVIVDTATERAYAIASAMDFDIIHDHTDYLYRGPLSVPVIRTIHGPVTPEHLLKYREMTLHGDRFIAISHRQRALFEDATEAEFGTREHIAFDGVLHNPVDVSSFPFYDRSEKEDYVAYLGRCHWEKGPSFAIQVARDAGVKLKMAMRVSQIESPYFNSVVKPLIDEHSDVVDFLGEVSGTARTELLGRARALLFTSTWEEPFGLAMVEALATGTPVVALNRGSAPEVVEDGVTGVLANTWTEMNQRVKEAMALEPQTCRDAAMQRFDRSIIGPRHVALYEQVISEKMMAPALATVSAGDDRFIDLDGEAPPQLLEQPMRETPVGWMHDGMLVASAASTNANGPFDRENVG